MGRYNIRGAHSDAEEGFTISFCANSIAGTSCELVPHKLDDRTGL
jgi:hypothetical protein